MKHSERIRKYKIHFQIEQKRIPIEKDDIPVVLNLADQAAGISSLIVFTLKPAMVLQYLF